jgi:vacuolar-type H+-ATPase subunit C/Vma6
LVPHLLAPHQIEGLTKAPDLPALGESLRALGFIQTDDIATADALELSVRRAAADRLRTIGRWAGHARHGVLALVFEDEDRRSLRALLRAAMRGAAVPAEERLAGLIPTPALPERALLELARQTSPAAIAALLTAWGDPYGPALLPAAQAAEPDLLELEQRLSTTFAARALAGARASGSAVLVALTRESIDLENAATALVLASEGAAEQDFPAKRWFIEEGSRIPLPVFLEAAGAGAPRAAARVIAAAFGPGPISAALEGAGGDPTETEDALLKARIVALERRCRHDPIGPATVIWFSLRLRAEVVALRRVIWGVAMGAPAPAPAPV